MVGDKYGTNERRCRTRGCFHRNGVECHHGEKFCKPQRKKKVEKSIEELEYKVNLLARGLKIKHTYTIGVVLPDITKIFFPNVLKGIETAAKKAGYKVNFLSSNFDFATERESVEYLKASYVDGIIIDSCCKAEELAQWAAQLSEGEENRFPVVSMEQVMDSSKISSVLVDFEKLSSMATAHLIAQGKQRILYIKAGQALRHGQERYQGYLNALKEHQISFCEDLVLEADFSALSAYQATQEALKRGVCFDAVQTLNDQMAIGALKALKEAGISVPGEVAVAGCDNIFPSTLVNPQITTIDLPKYEMGYTAFEELKRLMDGEGKAAPRSVILEAELIIRQSTAAEKSGDWNLLMW